MPQPTLGLPANRSFNLPSLRHPLISSKSFNKPHHDSSSTSSTEIIDSCHRRNIDRRPSAKSAMDMFTGKEKRRSFGLQARSSSPAAKGSPKNSPKVGPAKPAKLVVDMESPPLVFYGTPNTSSGALLSGQLLLTVTDPEITLESFDMTLTARISTRKPVIKDCPECSSKETVLFTWKFLTDATHFKKGIHTFPFSYLLPGHLPATSHGDLGSIDYMLDAKAHTNLSDKITVSRNLTVQRALMPGLDKNSIRIFPPTNLTATVAIPSVIHPIGQFPVQMRLTGIVDTSLKDVQRRWRIRKMNWRIDEHSKIISAACSKHTHKLGGAGKGILHEDTRSIGGDDLKGGWKTDFDTNGGQIELEFTAAVSAAPSSSHHGRLFPPLCDVDSPTGLAVHHNLVLEIVVAEEQTATKTGRHMAMPTGAARVLRMQFKLVLTERAGMGISWDEEQPPTYEDVPNSPPGYHKLDNWEGGELPSPIEEEVAGGRTLESNGR